MTLASRHLFSTAEALTPTRVREFFTTVSAERFEATPAKNGKRATLKGYAIVWNELSTDRGGYKVRLLPGSAKFATPTRAYYNHQSADFIGTTANKTLTLTPDDKGVFVEIILPDTQRGRDTYALVSDGYVTGMSFAMLDAPWAIAGWKESGPLIVPVAGAAEVVAEAGQTVINVSGGYEVDEVTITPDPAFSTTTIAAGAPQAIPVYSHRAAHANRLQLFKLQTIRLDAGRLADATTTPETRA